MPKKQFFVHSCSMPALAHKLLPRVNAGTLAPWCKGAFVLGRLLFVQEGTSSCTKAILGGFFLFLRVLRNACTLLRGARRQHKTMINIPP